MTGSPAALRRRAGWLIASIACAASHAQAFTVNISSGSRSLYMVVGNGNITAREMQIGLSIGIAISVGLAMMRILTGISIMWLLIPGYAIALIMTFFVPQLFTGVAFDSGGVASGPMTATFLSPIAMGACEAVGGNMMTDAFGIVAMVAMTPLVTIQLLGLRDKLRRHARKLPERVAPVDERVVYYD